MEASKTQRDVKKSIVNCAATLINSPCEETYQEYIFSIEMAEKSELSESKLRRVLLNFIYAYLNRPNKLLERAIDVLPVQLNGSRAEDAYIDLLKYQFRHPFSRAGKAKKMLLRKCSMPDDVRFHVSKRIQRKIHNKLCRLLHKAGKVPMFFRRQYLYKKYGYTKTTLKAWESLKKQDCRNNPNADRKRIAWAHKHGFLYARIHQYSLTDDNLDQFVSDLDYILLNPINNSYKKWIEDIPSMRYCLAGQKDCLPEMYFHVIRRDGKAFFVRMPDCPDGYNGDDVQEALRLLREKKHLIFRPAAYTPGAKIYALSYEDGYYVFAGERLSEKTILGYLTSQEQNYVLLENISMRKDISQMDTREIVEFRAVILNEKVFFPYIAGMHAVLKNGGMIEIDPDKGTSDEVVISDWEYIRQKLLDFSNTIPQIEYYSVNFKITERGLCVMSCNPHPALLRVGPPNEKIMTFLRKKVVERRAMKRQIITWKHMKGFFWSYFKKHFCRRGYRDFMLHEYVDGVINDVFHFKRTTLRQKLWCYKRGYYSFRLSQYNLKEENWRNFLSDRDYHWLCPINNTYQKWIDDKMTYRGVIEPFAYAAPRYYYHIMNRNGDTYAIRMGDCPPQYASSFDGIIDLLRDVGALAVKQSAGEHGDGFFKLSYKDGKYYINHDEADYRTVLMRLKGLTRYYNVTEFLSMHESLRPIYPGSVNTVRVMVLNPTGCNPYIANAYLRIGTGSTKMTDNIGYGGVFAKVDIDTGRFYGAERLQNHIIVPCQNHPDTGVLIEGILPYWEDVKKTLVNICNYLGQLEYLGFDVALSSEGVRILEINKYQDLHRCAFYGDRVQNYFKGKIAAKERALQIKRKQ